MSNVPSVVSKRFITTIPKFKKVLSQALERDVNEADTVTIITDMLEQIFGFDKYSEITREFAIQGTFCDLAIKSEKRVEYLIEVKAIGIDLKDNHLRQAVNYASREGIKWVVLTNGINWQIHRVSLDGKVESEKLCTIDFMDLNVRNSDEQEMLFMLCKRGLKKDLIDEFYEFRQSVNRYTIGAILSSEPVVSVIRRELKKLKPGIKVEANEISDLLENEIIKREIIENESTKEASKQILKFAKSQNKTKSKVKRIKPDDSVPEMVQIAAMPNNLE